MPVERSAPVLLAAALPIARSVETTRAAPINCSRRGTRDDKVALASIFGRVERWQAVRAILQLLEVELVPWLRAMAPDGPRAATDVDGNHPKEGRP